MSRAAPSVTRPRPEYHERRKTRTLSNERGKAVCQDVVVEYGWLCRETCDFCIGGQWELPCFQVTGTRPYRGAQDRLHTRRPRVRVDDGREYSAYVRSRLPSERWNPEMCDPLPMAFNDERIIEHDVAQIRHIVKIGRGDREAHDERWAADVRQQLEQATISGREDVSARPMFGRRTQHSKGETPQMTDRKQSPDAGDNGIAVLELMHQEVGHLRVPLDGITDDAVNELIGRVCAHRECAPSDWMTPMAQAVILDTLAKGTLGEDDD
jgi:hypothetical protein